MAKEFRVTPLARFINRVVITLHRLGIPAGPFSILTVPGRKTGTPRSTPITIGRHEGHEYIVSPSGAGDWVKNLRAASGHATVQRGRRTDAIRAIELDRQETARFLRDQMRSNSKAATRFLVPYCDVDPDSPLAVFETEAPRHPVFRVERLGRV